MAGDLQPLTGNFSTTTGKTFPVDSATYTAGKTYIMLIRNRRTAAASESPSSISGGNAGNVWVKPTNAADFTYDNTNREYMTTWVMVCTVTETVALAINFTNNQVNCTWSVSEGTDLDTSNINALIVQAKTVIDQGVTNPSLTFNNPFSNANNLTFAAADFSATGTNRDIEGDSNMIELHDLESSGLNVGYLHTQWKVGEESTVNWTKDISTISSHYIAELKVLVAAAAPPARTLLGVGT
ncbi:MAG: hypothetical protein AB7E70_20405 [Hyphomicrobiaceae bacterium]